MLNRHAVKNRDVLEVIIRLRWCERASEEWDGVFTFREVKFVVAVDVTDPLV